MIIITNKKKEKRKTYVTNRSFSAVLCMRLRQTNLLIYYSVQDMLYYSCYSSALLLLPVKSLLSRTQLLVSDRSVGQTISRHRSKDRIGNRIPEHEETPILQRVAITFLVH